MRHLTKLLLFAALGFFLSQSASAQPGGGFGGGGAFGGQEQDQQQEQTPLSELIQGRWDIEFRVQYLSADPEAAGRWLEIEAEIFVNGDQIEGRIRDDDVIGEFRCMYDGKDRCQFGTLRFQNDDQDWQDFGFVVDRYGQRATGQAEWIDVETGEIRRFELRLRKR